MQEFILMIAYKSKSALELSRALLEDENDPVREVLNRCRIRIKDVQLTWGCYHKVVTCEAQDNHSIGKAMESIRRRDDLRSELLLILPHEQYLQLLRGIGSQRTKCSIRCIAG